MGGYSSIEDLKNDANIRDLIKEAINSVYEMQEQYKESVKEGIASLYKKGCYPEPLWK